MIHAEMYRPEHKFGWSVIVWMEDPLDGRRKVLHISTDGVYEWKHVQPNTTVEPTYYFDDDIMEALDRVHAPRKTADPDVQDVLQAALAREGTTTDHLFALVKTLVDHTTQ